MVGQCAGPRALARHAFSRRGPGRRADAGGLHGQLGQGHRQRAARRRLFSRDRAAGDEPRPDVQQLARRAAARACSSCICSRSPRRRESIDLSSAYFVPDALDRCGARRRGEARREDPYHHAGRAHGRGNGAARVAGRLGRPAARRASRSTISADDVPLQGAGRRRPVVSVGSTNFDSRSFALNDEANLNILDADFRPPAGRHLRARSPRSQRSRSAMGAARRCPRSCSSTPQPCCERSCNRGVAKRRTQVR